MNQITEFCTGCRTCEQLCPKSCITMEYSSEGFIEPRIDVLKCVDCGLCQKRCPQNIINLNPFPKDVYAVRYKNDNEILQSASGGVFVALAKYFLEQEGACVGAVYLDNWTVGHIVVRDEKDLPKLQSSKYVQSDTMHTYTEIRNLLNSGVKVLFSGTPCQVAGLKSFLENTDITNLLTIDLICHGVPSIKLFKNYMAWLGGKMGGNIVSYNFRDKTAGWGLNYKAKTITKTQTKSCVIDPYYYHFLQGNTYRECCYHCKYCKVQRAGDMTIGDYWGIEEVMPDFFSKKGVSCLLINSEKAVSYIPLIQSLFYVRSSTLADVMKHQHNLSAPTSRPAFRDIVYQSLNHEDINVFFKTVLTYPDNRKAEFLAMLPEWLKKELRRMLSWLKKQ